MVNLGRLFGVHGIGRGVGFGGGNFYPSGFGVGIMTICCYLYSAHSKKPSLCREYLLVGRRSCIWRPFWGDLGGERLATDHLGELAAKIIYLIVCALFDYSAVFQDEVMSQLRMVDSRWAIRIIVLLPRKASMLFWTSVSDSALALYRLAGMPHFIKAGITILVSVLFQPRSPYLLYSDESGNWRCPLL